MFMCINFPIRLCVCSYELVCFLLFILSGKWKSLSITWNRHDMITYVGFNYIFCAFFLSSYEPREQRITNKKIQDVFLRQSNAILHNKLFCLNLTLFEDQLLSNRNTFNFKGR